MDYQIGLHTKEHANPMKVQWKSIIWEHKLLILEKYQKDVKGQLQKNQVYFSRFSCKIGMSGEIGLMLCVP